MPNYPAAKNNASSTVGTATASLCVGTDVILANGGGNKFPATPTPFFVTICQVAFAYSPTATTSNYTIYLAHMTATTDHMHIDGLSTVEGDPQFDRPYAVGDIVELRVTAGTLNQIYTPFTASGASTSPGIVPAPSSTAGTTHYLREDATWALPSGGGLAIGGAVSGGTMNRVLYESAGPVLADSGNLTFTGSTFTVLRSTVTPTGLVPSMTSNATPSPYVASDSGDIGGGYEAYRAFDGVFSTEWAIAGASGILTVDLGSGNAGVCNQYTITGPNLSTEQSPSTWTFQGSNDGSTWTTLDTQTNVQWTNPQQIQNFVIGNMLAWRYYRINISANFTSPNYTAITQLDIITNSATIRYNVLNVSASGIFAYSTATGNVVLNVAGISGQTADLQVWTDNNNNVLSAVGPAGHLRSVVQSSGITPTSTPPAGSMVFDTNSNRMWVYNGTAWKYEQLA